MDMNGIYTNSHSCSSAFHSTFTLQRFIFSCADMKGVFSVAGETNHVRSDGENSALPSAHREDSDDVLKVRNPPFNFSLDPGTTKPCKAYGSVL